MSEASFKFTVKDVKVEKGDVKVSIGEVSVETSYPAEMLEQYMELVKKMIGDMETAKSPVTDYFRKN